MEIKDLKYDHNYSSFVIRNLQFIIDYRFAWWHDETDQLMIFLSKEKK